VKPNPYILTLKGNHFDFLNMQNNTFDPEEIGHALSMVCRFGGQCRHFYSVAQHSVIVSRLAGNGFRMAGLLHDAMEAYLGDITTPLKQLLPEYQDITKRAEDWLVKTTGYDIHAPEVKYADLQALGMEKRDLMSHDYQDWPWLDGISIPSDIIIPIPPKEAFELFMETYELYKRNEAFTDGQYERATIRDCAYLRTQDGGDWW